MKADRQLVVIARVLLPAGRDRLAERYELREGGLDATRDDLLSMVPGASAIVSDSSVPIDMEVLDAAGDRLRVVANFAVGHDNVDLEACRERGVVVTNTPDVLTEATAELAMALTFAAARRTSDAERDLRAGRWRGWDPAAYRGIEIRGSTVGVVGMGRIGARYAALAHGLGAAIVYTSPSPKPEAESELGARHLDLQELLEASDIVSIHAPSTPETRGLIGSAEVELIGPEGVLVNTSRGPSGRLGGRGGRPGERDPRRGRPRRLRERARGLAAAARGAARVLLPHIGSATIPSRDGMAGAVADNVIAVLEGREPPSWVA